MIPRLSVVIPVYNCEKTLIHCLSKIKKSEYKDFEIIVIDDGSTDNSVKVADKYADQVIAFKNNQGKQAARKAGVDKAKGEIIVNIDADVLIKPNTLGMIAEYFTDHQEVSAVTGLLDWNYDFLNFSTQYKNLYMNFYFSQLPQEVTFLYGSIFAIKKNITQKLSFINPSLYGEDTDLGQQMIENNQIIHLIKKLSVVHLKKYSLKSLLINDFQISYSWAKLFWIRKGWRQLGRKKTGFAHASMSQIISLLIVPFIVLFLIGSFFSQYFLLIAIFSLLMWVIININFLYYIFIKKRTLFFLKSFVFTFFDHLTMILGAATGSLFYLFGLIH